MKRIWRLQALRINITNDATEPGCNDYANGLILQWLLQTAIFISIEFDARHRSLLMHQLENRTGIILFHVQLLTKPMIAMGFFIFSAGGWGGGALFRFWKNINWTNALPPPPQMNTKFVFNNITMPSWQTLPFNLYSFIVNEACIHIQWSFVDKEIGSLLWFLSLWYLEVYSTSILETWITKMFVLIWFVNLK